MYKSIPENIRRYFEEGTIEVTNRTSKERFGKELKELPIYRVRVSKLYLNDRNGRIKSSVYAYGSSNNIKLEDLKAGDLEKYNETLSEFIKKAEDETFNNTKNNIKLLGQQKPGLILLDGRVIDGNRRLTCLRQLKKEQLTDIEKYEWFDAVIIEKENIQQISDKVVRELEYNRQYGEERPVDFCYIDMALTIREDIDEYGFTEQDIVDRTTFKIAQIKEYYENAKVMDQFLEFINAAKNYELLKKLNVEASLREFNKTLKKIAKNDDEENDLGQILFTYILTNPTDSDIRNVQRKIKDFCSTKKLKDDFIKSTNPLVDSVLDNLPERIEIIDDYNHFKEKFANEPSKTKEQLNNVFHDLCYRNDIITKENTPSEKVQRALDIISEIDDISIKALKENTRMSLIEELTNLQENIVILLNKCN